MRGDFGAFDSMELLQAVIYTLDCSCYITHLNIVKELQKRAPNPVILLILNALTVSKFGCPAATCLLVKLDQASYDERNFLSVLTDVMQ